MHVSTTKFLHLLDTVDESIDLSFWLHFSDAFTRVCRDGVVRAEASSLTNMFGELQHTLSILYHRNVHCFHLVYTSQNHTSDCCGDTRVSSAYESYNVLVRHVLPRYRNLSHHELHLFHTSSSRTKPTFSSSQHLPCSLF